MTGKQLRTSILQEAIAGRLVPQDPGDEPASKLLKRINPKAKPLETEQPLPEGWCACQLKDMVSITTGDKDANHGKENGQYDFFTCARTPIKSDTYSFEGESLILPGNGDIGLITHYNGRFEAYQRTYVLQALSADVYLRYLYWHMSANWRAYNKDRLYGTAIPYIRLGNLATYPVYLPPLAEQKRIVAKIEELMPLVDEYEKAQEEFDNLNAGLKSKFRASLLQEAFTGRLVLQNSSDEPASKLLRRINSKAKLLQTEQPLPQGWCACSVSTIADIFTGDSINKEEKEKKYTGLSAGYNYIATKDVGFDGVIDYDNGIKIPFKTKFKIAHKGSTLLCIEGGSAGRKIGVLTEDVCFGNKLCAFEPNGIDEKYLYYYLQSPTFVSVFKDNKTGMIGGVKRSALAAIEVLVPPLAEQKRIVEKLESMFAELDKLDACGN